MGDHEFRITDKHIFFNNCIFTDKQVPLPISDDEKILLFYEDVKFYCSIGSGTLIGTIVHKCSTGKLFLTNYRLVYLPLMEASNSLGESFSSFHCSLDMVKEIEQGVFSLKLPRGQAASSNVYLDIYDSSESNTVFHHILFQKTCEFKDLRRENVNDTNYFYSDIIERQNL